MAAAGSLQQLPEGRLYEAVRSFLCVAGASSLGTWSMTLDALAVHMFTSSLWMLKHSVTHAEGIKPSLGDVRKCVQTS